MHAWALCSLFFHPKSAKLNSCVERMQRTFHEEFCIRPLLTKIPEFQKEFDAILDYYNRERPHRALGGLAPLEYLAMIQKEAASKSLMCVDRLLLFSRSATVLLGMEEAAVLSDERHNRKKRVLGSCSCKKIFLSFFTFEFSFLLFLMAGRFKADPRFSWAPVDLTLLFMFLSLLTGMFILLKVHKYNKIALLGVMLYLIFAGWVAISLQWAPSSPYALDKTLRISILVFWSYVGAALIIANDRVRVMRFYTLLVIFSLWFALEAWSTYLRAGLNGPTLETVLGGNYLGVGRSVGLGLIVLVVLLLFRQRTKGLGSALPLALGAAFFFATLLIIGGRGPFIAAVLSITFAILLTKRTSKIIVLFLIAIVAIFIAGNTLPLTTLYRLQTLIEEPFGGTSAHGRIQRIEGALQQVNDAPIFGKGVGSFYYYHGDSSLNRDYPHNIFLELASELGLIGILLFLSLVFLPITKLQRKILRRDPVCLIALLFVLNTFLNAMISGDLPDNRLLFAALGLLTGLDSPRNTRLAGDG